MDLKQHLVEHQVLNVEDIGFNDNRYVNVIGDLMNGDLGIQPSTNSLTAIYVNDKDANNVLTVDTINNRVGIGTTSPGNKLDVNGGVAIGSYAGVNTAPTNGAIISGNVAIGATSPYLYDSTPVGLTVKGTGTYGVIALQAAQPLIKWTGTYNSGNGAELYQNTKGQFLLNVSSTIYGFAIDATGSSRFGQQPNSNISFSSSVAPSSALGKVHITSNGVTSATNALYVENSTPTGLFVIRNDGNVGIGTTNPAVKLQVNSVLADESASLGSELLSADNWTAGTGWSGDFASGFAHTSGTADLSNTLAGVINNYYQITYTVTGRTAGSFTITFGGQSWSGINSTGSFGPKATTTDSLVITPTDTFNGTIVLSIKQITGTYLPTFALYDSTGASNFEIRNSKSSLDNIFIGNGAGRYNTTGYQNSSFGNYALYSNTTGRDNLAIGENALRFNTTGYSNSAQGVASLYSNTTGYNNAGLGAFSLYSNTTGSNNSAQGLQALYFNTTGSNNSAIGINALYANKTGSRGVAIGNESQMYANDTTTPWTNANTSVGFQALRGSTTAADNTGSYNTAIGYQSLLNNTSGGKNTATGYGTLLSNTSGEQNSAIGLSALSNLTGSSNDNTALGYNAGRYYNGTTGNLTTAKQSLFLGSRSSALADSGTNEIVIGYNTIGKGSNTAVIGNNSITDVYLSSDTGATVHAGKFKLGALNTAPASASATGTLGEIRFTADAIYFCIATDTWVKATLASW
jgi:hypothetical protein